MCIAITVINSNIAGNYQTTKHSVGEECKRETTRTFSHVASHVFLFVALQQATTFYFSSCTSLSTRERIDFSLTSGGDNIPRTSIFSVDISFTKWQSDFSAKSVSWLGNKKVTTCVSVRLSTMSILIWEGGDLDYYMIYTADQQPVPGRMLFNFVEDRQ